MPSDLTGRCYCGAVTFRATAPPLIVTYCHCDDCRRASGAPVAAFAAFAAEKIDATGPLAEADSAGLGAHRQFCRRCGSQVLASYDYLPDQVYVSIGCIDQAAELPPARHSHHDTRLHWLRFDDDLPRSAGSGRDALVQPGD